MATSADNCERLRKLEASIRNELAALQQGYRQEDAEGVGSPTELVNIIKSLEQTLYTITLELKKCPPLE